MKTITCFEIVDQGIDHAQYFQGCGVSRTKFTDCTTGCGDNPSEALNDALESLAQAGWDVSKVAASAEGVAYAKAVKPSASDEVREQLKADNPQGNNESDADYSARIGEYQSDCDSELYYYVSVRVSDQTDWDETPEGFVDYVLPSAWASYLVNGDASGLEEHEKAEAEAFLAKDGLRECCDCSAESFFSHRPDSGLAGDCLNYRFKLDAMNTEIDVSPLLASPGFDPWNCCNSVANLGQNAGKLTWQASQRHASALSLTAEQKEAFRDFVRSSGGWDDEETAAFSDTDLTALCVQWIAGDIREGFGDGVSNDPAEWDWEDYNQQAERGSVPSTLYLHNGKLFWSCQQ